MGNLHVVSSTFMPFRRSEMPKQFLLCQKVMISMYKYKIETLSTNIYEQVMSNT